MNTTTAQVTPGEQAPRPGAPNRIVPIVFGTIALLVALALLAAGGAAVWPMVRGGVERRRIAQRLRRAAHRGARLCVEVGRDRFAHRRRIAAPRRREPDLRWSTEAAPVSDRR